MKSIAFVPMKLNNERLPGKNTALLSGKPLCNYLLETLLKVRGFDQVVVYCSDDSICGLLPDGVTFAKRDKRLDGPVNAEELYMAFINDFDADIYCLAHVTSPFIETTTIQNALEVVASGTHDSAFTVKKLQTFIWQNNQPINYNPARIPRTQDLEPFYLETFGFFIFKKEIAQVHGRRIGFNPFPVEVSEREAVDIDTADDFRYAEFLVNRG